MSTPGRDAAVAATNDDATTSKRSAVRRGYWRDDFLAFFSSEPAERRPPLIHRGYYVRTTAVWQCVSRFAAAAGPDAQLVNLGAGFDTLFWRLQQAGIALRRVVDVDMEPVVARKKAIIARTSTLKDAVTAAGDVYHVLAADLRDTAALASGLEACGVDPAKPTLFISECVLVYMGPEEARALLRWAAATFPTAAWINYEPIRPHDAFGQVMVANLKRRGCDLAGIHGCPSMEAQVQRFTSEGWTTAKCMDLGQIYHCLPLADLRRMERIEPLDEFEEWNLFNQHYCISWAYSDAAGCGLSAIDFAVPTPAVD